MTLAKQNVTALFLRSTASLVATPLAEAGLPLPLLGGSRPIPLPGLLPLDINLLDNIPAPANDWCLIPIKYFDIETQQMYYVGSIIFWKANTIGEVTTCIGQLLMLRGFGRRGVARLTDEDWRWSEGLIVTKPPTVKKKCTLSIQTYAPDDCYSFWRTLGLRAFEEENALTDKVTVQIDHKQTLGALQFAHGDMLVMQAIYTDDELQGFADKHKIARQNYLSQPAIEEGKEERRETRWLTEVKAEFHSTCTSMLHYIGSRIVVGFRLQPWPIHLRPADEADVWLELSQSTTHNNVRARLAVELKCHPNKLRLTRDQDHLNEAGKPRESHQYDPDPFGPDVHLHRMLRPTSPKPGPLNRILYYALFDEATAVLQDDV